MLFRSVAVVALRQGRRPAPDDVQGQAMGQVLQSLSLISADWQLLPMQKCDPASDPLYQMLQGGEG